MRKITLLVLSLVMSASLFAQSGVLLNQGAVNSADESIQGTRSAWLGCEERQFDMGFNAPYEYAIRLTPAEVTSGNTITKVKFYTDFQSYADQGFTNTSFTIKIYEVNGFTPAEEGENPLSVTGDAVYTQDYTATTNGFQEVTLTTPYEIDGGTEAWVAIRLNGKTVVSCGNVDANSENKYFGYYKPEGATEFVWLYSYFIFTNTDFGFAPFTLAVLEDDGAAVVDVAVENIVVPEMDCDLPTDQEISFDVVNNGDDIDAPFNVKYNINYGDKVSVEVPALAADETHTVRFSLDMSANGPYVIQAFNDLDGDSNADNNEAFEIAVNITDKTVTEANPAAYPFTTIFDCLDIKVIDNNTDFATWKFRSIDEDQTDMYAMYKNHATNAADDYFILNCIDLEPGTYSISFDTKVGMSTQAEKMNVLLGTSNEVADFTTTILELDNITNEDYETKTANFEITTAGTYYFAFKAVSDANKFTLYLDNINIAVSSATAIETNLMNNVAVYPNPAQNVLNIENAENATVSVLNMLGQTVRSEVAVSNKLTVDTSNLPEGTYVVRVQKGSEVENMKVNIVR